MAMQNGKPDWMEWIIFAGTFTISHFAFCVFIVVRNLVMTRQGFDADGFVGFVFFIFSGVLTGIEFAVGYAAVDIVVSTGRAFSRSVQRLSATFGGIVAYALVWIVLALRLQLPKLYENVAGSFLSGNFTRTFPWGAMFLGGLMACVVKSVATAFRSANQLPEQ
jgi:hypothetical protein